MKIAFLKLLEKILISGLSWVKAMWTGKQQFLLQSAKRIHWDAWCKIPTEGVLLRVTFAPFLTNFIEDLAEIGTASFRLAMKLLRTSMTPHKTVSCLNVYLPSCSDILQALEICALVHTSWLHKVHIASVVILHLNSHNNFFKLFYDHGSSVNHFQFWVKNIQNLNIIAV